MTDSTQAAGSGTTSKKSSGIVGYVSLLLFLLIFSGVLQGTPLKWLDYANLLGQFGNITGAEGNFMGSGGVGAREGFLIAFGAIPGVMLARGIVNVATHYKALDAAKVIFTPILRPLMGIPGVTALALVSSLTSSDSGSALTRDLFDKGYITDDERSIFAAFQLPASGLITNTINIYAVHSATIGGLLLSPGYFLILHLAMKVVAANALRLMIKFEPKDTGSATA